MPNNHSKYCIPVALRARNLARRVRPTVLRARSAALLHARGNALPRARRARASFHRDERGARIQAPHALVRQPFHFGRGEGKKLPDGTAGLNRPDPGQDHVPLRRLQLEVSERHRAVSHVNHINPIRQGGIELIPHAGRITRLGEGEFQVLSLACGSGRRGASVRDLRVRRETSG
jgi:hypothetical protein